MKELVSGMMLVEKRYGDLHFLIATPYGLKAIDTGGYCMEFRKENYTKAYIPKNYDDPCEPLEESIIEF